MAAAALARLELEINGGRGEGDRAAIAVRPLLESARRRWSGQAALVGAELALHWRAGEAVVEGDRIELAAALDNLIANAFEHGGRRIELVADDLDGRICLAVVDSGSGAGGAASRGSARARRGPFGRLSGHARHGHGLRLVRRTATRHGGAFALHFGERGTSAVLELPLAPRPARDRVPRAEIAIRRVRPVEGRNAIGGRVSRRARAIAFGLAALVAATLAGAIADGYGDSVARGYGALRPVVVASAQLPAGKALLPAATEADLEVREVPARFVPAGALRAPAEALGLEPVAAIPSGAYLLAAQLRPPHSQSPARPSPPAAARSRSR